MFFVVLKIFLALACHEEKILLLRDAMKYGKDETEFTDFCFIHVSLLREFIAYEFQALQVSIVNSLCPFVPATEVRVERERRLFPPIIYHGLRVT